MCLVCPTLAQFAWVSRALNILARVGTSFVQCFAWSAQAMYHLPGLVLALVSQTRANLPNLPYPLRSSLGYHGRSTYSPVLVLFAGISFVQCFARLVQCFAWSVRVMYLLALVRTYTGTSCAVGQHGYCTFLPVSLMCLRVRARVVHTCPRLYPCTVLCYG